VDDALGADVLMLDLFSGIGGFSLAAHSLGMETVAFCECEPYPQRVLRRHFPGVPIFDDVKDVDASAILGILAKTSGGDDMAGTLKKLTVEQAAEAVGMYDSGMSLAPIAEFYGVSRQAMWDLLRRRTTMRPQQRTGADNHFHRGTKADARAQNLLEYAVASGVVERKTHCEKCGDTGTMKDGRSAIQAHHDDYTKPLEVRWLCQRCHHEWHKTNEAVMPQEAPLIVTAGFP
jgi:ribosomal protein S27AE